MEADRHRPLAGIRETTEEMKCKSILLEWENPKEAPLYLKLVERDVLALATRSSTGKELDLDLEVRCSLVRCILIGRYYTQAYIITDSYKDAAKIFHNLYFRIWRLGYYKVKAFLVDLKVDFK